MNKKKDWMEIAQEVLGSIDSVQDEWLRNNVDVGYFGLNRGNVT